MKIKLLVGVVLFLVGCTEYKESVLPVLRNKAAEAVTQVFTGEGGNASTDKGAGGK